MKSVLKGFGDVSQTSDLYASASAGAYKFLHEWVPPCPACYNEFDPKTAVEKLLYSGSYLSYNEGVIGLTVLCMSFHARLCKLSAALSLQRSIYAG